MRPASSAAQGSMGTSRARMVNVPQSVTAWPHDRRGWGTGECWQNAGTVLEQRSSRGGSGQVRRGNGNVALMNFMAPDQVETHFTAAVSGMRPGPRLRSGMIRNGSALRAARCAQLFDAQLTSRHIDLAARWLQSKGAGFYTIGSSGHEGNAGVAAALRLTDPAMLHYRSGAFYLVRAGQASPPRDGVRDVMLGLVAAAAEPIAGGRHKVFGHRQL